MTAKMPVIWIVATGSEILQGHYSDRNGPWLSARLMQAGLRTARHLALPDEREALRAGLGEAIRAADLVITTGGLGPTEDDLNRELIAEIWQRELVEDAEALHGIEERLKRRGLELMAVNRVQGRIPRGSRLVANANGTAPGFYLPPESGRAALLALPGPPRELQPMFEESGLPLILEGLGWTGGGLRNVTFRTAGLPEAIVNERLRELFGSDPRVELALLFTPGTVDVRLTLLEDNPEAQARTIEEWRETIADRLGRENIYGENGDTQALAVARLLRERGQTLATAESCTGGLLAGTVIDVPGASQYFVEGFVTYADMAKTERLGVTPTLIERYGAVSPQVAEAMAEGARRVAGVDWAVSTTGIAGPEGGTPEKPVGLVWFGLARPNGEVSLLRHQFLSGTRDEIRQRSVQAGLDLLRRGLLSVPLAARLPEVAPRLAGD